MTRDRSSRARSQNSKMRESVLVRKNECPTKFDRALDDAAACSGVLGSGVTDEFFVHGFLFSREEGERING